MGASKLKHSHSRQRRGSGRVVAFLLAVLLAALAAGCGDEDVSESERTADVEILNEALAEELTLASVYARGLPLLRGPYVAVGRRFGAQSQENVDGIMKAIRGLGGEAEAELEEVDFTGVTNQADFLTLAYDRENAALAYDREVGPQLNTVAPQMLATSMATGHAQHLVILRQGLGVGLAASVPEAFEPGDLPAPTQPAPPGE